MYISIVKPVIVGVPLVRASLIVIVALPNSNWSSDSSQSNNEEAVALYRVTSYPVPSDPIVRVPFAVIAGVWIVTAVVAITLVVGAVISKIVSAARSKVPLVGELNDKPVSLKWRGKVVPIKAVVEFTVNVE